MYPVFFPVLCIFVLFGVDVGNYPGGVIVSIWLAVRLWPFRRLALVLYMCTSETFHTLLLYGFSSGGITSVSYGMTWGSVWGCCIFARPGVTVIFAFLFTL